MNKAEYTARNADLIAYLQTNGYALEKSGHEHRLKQPDSITVRGNKWFRHSEGFGGGPLEFLTHVEGKKKDDAIRMLTGIQAYSAPSRKYPVPVAVYGKSKPFALPEAASRAPHVLAYLTKARGIDGDIVMRLLRQKLIYQSKDYHNCVFVGIDPDGAARYATMRGTNTYTDKPFRRDVEGSDKSCNFHIQGVSPVLYVFESPIDLLSHATMQKCAQDQFFPHSEGWLFDHRLSLGGVADRALERYVNGHPGIETIVLCLDNDEAGLRAMDKYTEKYLEMGYRVEKMIPHSKDWNDDLLAMRNAYLQDTEAEAEM